MNVTPAELETAASNWIAALKIEMDARVGVLQVERALCRAVGRLPKFRETLVINLPDQTVFLSEINGQWHATYGGRE